MLTGVPRPVGRNVVDGAGLIPFLYGTKTNVATPQADAPSDLSRFRWDVGRALMHRVTGPRNRTQGGRPGSREDSRSRD